MGGLLPLVEHAIKKPIWDCRMCGQCVLHSTGMTCPMTCPKTLRNGPCGGVREDGHCEVVPEMRCVWVKAHDRAASLPLLPTSWREEFNHLRPPVNNALQGQSSWANLLNGRDRETPPGMGRGRGPRMSATAVNEFERLCQTRERPVVTAEFPSFDGGTLEDIRAAAERLAPWVDAINVTDNPAAHAHASNTAMAIALTQLGFTPILQIVCRDKNRLAIQADIVGVSMFGVQNICALTGDDVTAGDEPEARRVYDLDGPQLVKVASIMGTGAYLSGRSMTAPPHLFVGAVENPTAPPLEYRAERALKKVEAGARFLQLQIHYRPEQLEAFVAACVANGVAERAAILPTVCLTKAARALTFMNEHVPGISVPSDTIARVADSADPREESYALVRELAEHALSLPGVAGLHITDFRHDDSVRRLTEDLSIGPRSKERHAHSA